VYDFGAKRYVLARPWAWIVYGSNVNRIPQSLAVLDTLPARTKVLDVPCGGGIAFRSVPEDNRLEYVAVDLTSHMLSRARREANRLGRAIDIRTGDVEALPFADATFDVSLTYLGLHVFPHPAVAVAEIARVTRPGGELRGSAIVLGAGRRFDMAIAFFTRLGLFGPGCTLAELREWLLAAGCEDVQIDLDGSVAYFNARRSDG
jgi:SAM-dependent methyltransferase